MNLSPAVETDALVRRGQALRREYARLVRQADDIRPGQLLFVTAELKSIEIAKRRLDREVQDLQDEMDRSLTNVSFVVSIALTEVARVEGLLREGVQGLSESARRANRLVLAVHQLQEAAGAVAAVVERKRVLALASNSLYVAVTGILLGVFWPR